MFHWWGPVLWEQYGTTETGVVALVSPSEWLEHPGSVGHPFLTSEIRIYDDDGIPVSVGTVGHIYARMHGSPEFAYLGQPEATAAALRDGLVRTGDLGYQDADGFVFLADRSTDMVISGGINIYPPEVEAVLLEHPAVRDAAVFGIPDEEYGEALVADVEAELGADVDPTRSAGSCRPAWPATKCPAWSDWSLSCPATTWARSPNGSCARGTPVAPEPLIDRLVAFLRHDVEPAEAAFGDAVVHSRPTDRPAVMDTLRDLAHRRGLWNALLPLDRTGVKLTQRQLVPLIEVTGRSPFLASDALNLATPDAENAKLLDACGSAEQQQRWLDPLLQGTIRSSYCMTEPGAAGSDPQAMITTIDTGKEAVTVTGTKHWCTGAAAPDCQLLVVVGISHPEDSPQGRHTICLVPTATPGVHIHGDRTILGYQDGHRGGRPSITLDQVQLPRSSILGEPGQGLVLAQRLLGPARLHHCMRLVGTAERALQLLCERSGQRRIAGSALADVGVVRDWIAEARIRIEHLRALVAYTADLIDAGQASTARREISVLKASAPASVEWIVDKAIQAHGADGLSHELPLAMLWTYARTLRFSDGPDEAHRASIAAHELREVLR